MHSMPKERIVVVEEGADLLRDAVVRETIAYETMEEALNVCRPGGTVMRLPYGWVVFQPASE